MTKRALTNTAASVRQRPLNKARSEGRLDAPSLAVVVEVAAILATEAFDRARRP